MSDLPTQVQELTNLFEDVADTIHWNTQRSILNTQDIDRMRSEIEELQGDYLFTSERQTLILQLLWGLMRNLESLDKELLLDRNGNPLNCVSKLHPQNR